MTRDRSVVATLSSVVEDLYAGTLDDAAWGRALIGIIDMVRGSGAVLLAFNPSTGAVLRDENYRLDPSALDDYRRYWTFHDCRVERALNVPVGCPMTECTLQIPDWRRTSILNEFLIPSDHPHCMPVWLLKSDAKVVTLSLQGTRKRGPFGDHDIDILRTIAPHISRALEIRDRLQRAQVRADVFAERLETLSFGVVVLDSGGRILEANAIVRELLRGDHGIGRKPDGTLYLHQPAGGEFHRWIASGTPPAQFVGDLLHVKRENAMPLSVMVSPLPPERLLDRCRSTVARSDL